MPIQHFAPPAAIKAPPLSFATRTGDLLFISGIPGFDDKGALPESFEARRAYEQLDGQSRLSRSWDR